MLLDNIANFPNHRLKVVVIVSHRQTHAATDRTPSALADQSVTGVCSHVTVSSRCAASTRTYMLTHTSNELPLTRLKACDWLITLYYDYVTIF